MLNYFNVVLLYDCDRGRDDDVLAAVAVAGGGTMSCALGASSRQANQDVVDCHADEASDVTALVKSKLGIAN